MINLLIGYVLGVLSCIGFVYLLFWISDEKPKGLRYYIEGITINTKDETHRPGY